MRDELGPMFSNMVKMFSVLAVELRVFSYPANVPRPAWPTRPATDKVLHVIQEVEPGHRKATAMRATVGEIVRIILAVFVFRYRRLP
jgi:hypothetical protein